MAGRQFTDRFEYVFDIDRFVMQPSACLIAADHQNARDIEPRCRHQMRGCRLVAARQTHHAVKHCTLDRNLDIVHQQIARRHQITPTATRSRDEITWRRGLDLERQATRFANTLLDDPGDLVEVAEADRNLGG